MSILRLAVPTLLIGAAPMSAPHPVAAGAVAAAESFVVPPIVASGTRLAPLSGIDVRWQGDAAVLRGGTLVNAGTAPVTVRLAATIRSSGAAALVKRFTVTVLGRDGRRLFGYVRIPSGGRDANQPVIARSLHLALDAPGGGAPAALNGDYGVLFASGDYVGQDRVALRGLTDPSLFHFADGSLGVIASRVTMAGEPDTSAAWGALVFKADPADPASFSELGLVDLGTAAGVVRPRAVWDGASRRYLVGWNDRAGKPRWAPVADLARVERIATPFYPEDGGLRSRVVGAGNVGALREGTIAAVEDAVAGGLPVTAATAKALIRRFGRVTNTGVRIAPFTIHPGDVAALARAHAHLGYSDGSTATRPVDWDAADLRRLGDARAGILILHGTVRQRAYPAILAYNRADPDIYRWEQDGRVRYLFVATDDTGNNNIGSPHLPLRVADSIAGLADAPEVDVLDRKTHGERTAEGRTIAGCYWAPELHEIGGRLSILFAPCFNPKDDRSADGGSWLTVASHIMQLRPGGDPAVAADWSRPAAVLQADGSPLGRAGHANISLDMSYFEAGGRGYYIWSQRYLSGPGPIGDPLTWIAPVDPANPTRLAGAPRPIIAPERSYEENLAEGGFVVTHGGVANLLYSSSGVSPTYVVSGARARIGSDLTAIDIWRKWQAPLQHSVPMPPGPLDYRTYEQGPGHGAFTVDEDGNDLYVYHSWGDGVGGNGRDARVRRVHWAAGGRPVLDMTDEEEVAPALRRVAVRVTVRGASGVVPRAKRRR